MIKVFFTTILSLFLIGCTTKQESIKVEMKPDTSYLPDDYLLKNVRVPRPPNKRKFLKASKNKKIEMLTKYNIRLLYTIDKANIRFTALRKWKKKELEILNKKKKTGEH